MRIEIRNEIRKWFVGILTTFGMTTIIVSLLRPMLDADAQIQYGALPVGFIVLGVAVWLLTKLEANDG